MTLPKAAVIGSAQIKLRPAWSGAQRSDLISAGSGVNCGPNGAMSVYSIIYLQLAARLAPPYIYAKIVLGGAWAQLVYSISGFETARAKELLKPGPRVRAVWSEERSGSLNDFSYRAAG